MKARLAAAALWAALLASPAGAGFAEDAPESAPSEGLDRRDPPPEPAGSYPPTDDEARRAEDELDAYAAGAKAEIKEMNDLAKEARRRNGSLTEAQRTALDDFQAHKAAALERVDELAEADIETAATFKGRTEGELAALRASYQRLRDALP